MEINKTVIVASHWFLYYLTYVDDVRSNTNEVEKSGYYFRHVYCPYVRLSVRMEQLGSRLTDFHGELLI